MRRSKMGIKPRSTEMIPNIGVLGCLGIVFVMLKLCEVIDWSWWLVTLPFWGGLALLAMVGLVYFVYEILTEK